MGDMQSVKTSLPLEVAPRFFPEFRTITEISDLPFARNWPSSGVVRRTPRQITNCFLMSRQSQCASYSGSPVGRREWSGVTSSRELVAHTRLELVISALRGRRVNQLHQCASNRIRNYRITRPSLASGSIDHSKVTAHRRSREMQLYLETHPVLMLYFHRRRLPASTVDQ